MHLYAARVLILGLGISGESAASLCASQGAKVTVYDQRTASRFAAPIGRLTEHEIDYQLGSVRPPDPTTFDLLVRSPGIPAAHPTLRAAATAGVPVWSEIELAGRLFPCPIIGVTGTNGKGTTTALITAMFTAAGRTAHRAGNMGIPLGPLYSSATPGDVLVLEISAGQLENVDRFAPNTAVITNVKPEHRNLYSWNDYVSLKARLLRNHGAGSTTVVCYDDTTARGLATAVPGRVIYASTSGRLPAVLDGVFVEDGEVIARQGGRQRTLLSVADLGVRGVRDNLPAAAATAMAWGIGDEAIRSAAFAYTGQEHVLEFVTEVAGVAYYDDAKATNPWSLLHAVQSFDDRPVVLIAGGKDSKAVDFSPLASPIMRRVRHLVLFGESSEAIRQALATGGITPPTTAASNFITATDAAQSLAVPGDVVVFSPGTHTWDMNPDYLTRGTHFKKRVLRKTRSLVA